MADNLLKTHPLKGLKAFAVLDLLGEPTAQVPSSFSYFVGYMGFDPTCPMVLGYDLTIDFEGGVVEAAYLSD